MNVLSLINQNTEHNGLPFLNAIREKSFSYLKSVGFPTRKMEDWRFTNINPILDGNFVLTFDNISLSRDEIEPLLIPNLDSDILTFVNGGYQYGLSNRLEGNNKKVIANSLSDALKQYPDIITQHFGKYLYYGEDGFVALNTLSFRDGAFIVIPENYDAGTIVLINITDTRHQALLVNTRNLVVLSPGSKVNIVELYHTVGGDEQGFSNVATEVICLEDSELNYYKIQNQNLNEYHINTTQIMQEQHSKVTTLTVSWGGSIVRNTLNIQLVGTQSESIFHGLYFLKDSQHVDNHTIIEHIAPDCHSNEYYKGIIDDEGDAVFNGKILVKRDAQKTNAYQLNKNILLSPNASINSKPQLEIFADDVKCSHGATTGQIDKEQLFYLLSRGIPKSEANKLLLYAFGNDIFESVSLKPLCDYLETKLEEKINESFTK
ncbi:MAG: Fe-S cluster assembly protein SufD [Ignavibacteria bacterium]